jgi:hypothetical protein
MAVYLDGATTVFPAPHEVLGNPNADTTAPTFAAQIQLPDVAGSEKEIAIEPVIAPNCQGW